MKTITQIALNNMKQNKSKNILIGIAIFLAVTLLTTIGLGAYGIILGNMQGVGARTGDYHAVYADLNDEQLEALSINGDVISLGRSVTFAISEIDDVTGVLRYVDDTAMTMNHLELVDGTMPTAENEIAGPTELFQMLGYEDTALGDTVIVPYRIDGAGVIIEKEFLICGICPSSKAEELQKVYTAFISQALYEKDVPQNDREYMGYLKVNGEDSLDFNQMVEKIENLGEDIGVHENSIISNKEYLVWATDPGTETIVTAVGVICIIILFSIIVIYNIFYAGLIQKVQEYGKLRAIGATKKQIKGIILREGMFVAFVSIPLGLIVGWLGATALVNITFKMYNTEKISVINIPILLIVIALAFLTVYFSLKKPMKVASGISPVEAMLYQGISKKEMKKRRGREEMSLLRLTFSNISSNRKRTLTTIVTMGLSCVLFVVVANVLGSMTANEEAREAVEKGEIKIALEGAAYDDTYKDKMLNYVQAQGLINDKFINNISDIDGVSKVEVRKIVLASLDKVIEGQEYGHFRIAVVSREEFDDLKEKMEFGTMDYDSAVENNGLIYIASKAYFDWGQFTIGEELDMTLYDGSSKIAFTGVMQACTEYINDYDEFVMTEDTFNHLGFKTDVTSDLFIHIDGEESSILDSIEMALAGSAAFKISSYTKVIEETEESIKTVIGPIYALLGILGVIGFMNMANTMITSIVSRRREFGTLQAIGLTTKQLQLMLQMEGLVFTIGTLLISLTVGNLLGYGAFCWLKSIQITYISTYSFPTVELGVMVIALLALQLVLSFYMGRNLQKDSLIDRIRYN